VLPVFENSKTGVVRKWTNAIFAMYPFESTGFLRTQKDRFANPVGHATEAAAALLYDAVTGQDVEEKPLNLALAELIRIRAVQDMPPSKAIGVLFLLKPLLRELLAKLPAAEREAAAKECLEMESRVDSLALIAFDLYMEDKTAMFRGRVAEIRRRYTTIERWIASRGMEGLFPEKQEVPGERPSSENLKEGGRE